MRPLAEIRRELSLRRTLVDGSILSALLGAIMLAGARYNPEIWVNDYPPAIRAKAGRRSEREARQAKLLGLPFAIIFFGVLVYSSRKLRRENGGRLSFLAALVHAYSVFMLFNLFDLVVIDYLVFVKLRPDFIVLPGTEGMPEYGDMSFHAGAFLKGLGIGVVPSMIVALFTRGR